MAGAGGRSFAEAQSLSGYSDCLWLGSGLQQPHAVQRVGRQVREGVAGAGGRLSARRCPRRAKADCTGGRKKLPYRSAPRRYNSAILRLAQSCVCYGRSNVCDPSALAACGVCPVVLATLGFATKPARRVTRGARPSAALSQKELCPVALARPCCAVQSRATTIGVATKALVRWIRSASVRCQKLRLELVVVPRHRELREVVDNVL